MIEKIVIVEDEKPNADRLARLIKEIKPAARIAAVIDSVCDAVEWFENNASPDLVLMDVRLCDGLCFEIFDKVKLNSPVIFTTAYDEYAVKAFKYNSIDYLLKPIAPEELQAALTKLDSVSVPLQMPAIEALKDLLQTRQHRSRFLLPQRDGYKTLLVSDILYFYSEMRITRARTTEGAEEAVPQTLEELEQQLDPTCFFRVNRQFIVHIDAIERVHHYFNGKLKLDIRKNADLEVLVSRERAGALKSWLDF